MRSLKSSGGLTHGRVMTEEQRFLWTMSSPVCSEYYLAMSDFNKRAFSTSEQYKDLMEARLKKNQSYLIKIREKLKLHNPLTHDFELRNIIRSVKAKQNENVDEYETIGQKLIDKMVGELAVAYSFKRKEKAKTLADSSCIDVDSDRKIDSALLFQRMLVASKSRNVSMT